MRLIQRKLPRILLSLVALLASLGVARPASATCFDTPRGKTICAVAGTAPGTLRELGPEDIRARTVLPKVKTQLLGWVEYDRFSCVGTAGVWAITSPASQGQTSTEIVHRTLTNGDCPGIAMPFNFMDYQWQTAKEQITSDTFEATWTSPGFTRPEHFDITKAHVQVQSFDVTTGLVQLNLVGLAGSSGTLKATFLGSPVNAAPQTTASALGPGAATMLIDRPALLKSKYSSLAVEWNAAVPALSGRLKPAKPWNVLGVVRFSQYNAPHESECGGSVGDYFVVDSLKSCNFTSTSLRQTFASQVKTNGTGLSMGHGLVQWGYITRLAEDCAGKFPPGATSRNSYLQVDAVRGICNRALVANNSVATAPVDGLACKTPLSLVTTGNANFGNRTRLDECPDCDSGFMGTEGHIDNFTDSIMCKAHEVGDLGNFWTVQTP